MKAIFAVFLILPFFPGAVAFARLCDNVFEQARDNLVVKVDIRDGQLRIGEEASFNVYVMNTMDRDIAELTLEVDSNEFVAEVSPSSGWATYPRLNTTRRENVRWGRGGGEKEHFAVTLRRKPGVPDGRYRIGLNLVSRRQGLSFRAVDLDSAADIRPLPKIETITVDGAASRAEWGDAYLCTDFHAYRRVGQYYENVTADNQTRVRVAHEEDSLYLLVMFHGADEADKDFFSAYLAPSVDDAPTVLRFDRKTGQVLESDVAVEDVKSIANQPQNLVEIRLSRAGLGIEDLSRFYMNFTRTTVENDEEEITFWRGNRETIMQPVSYAQFVFEIEN